MKYDALISLVVKVMDSDIFESTGEVEGNGLAMGFEISIDCLGLDNAGKVLNVNIQTDADTYEEACTLTEDLSCGEIYHVRGLFFLDSDGKYDIITMYNPTYEPVLGEERSFYYQQLERYQCEERGYIYRLGAK